MRAVLDQRCVADQRHIGGQRTGQRSNGDLGSDAGRFTRGERQFRPHLGAPRLAALVDAVLDEVLSRSWRSQSW